MSRVKLTDSLMGAIIKMSDGNPGATSVLVQVVTDPEEKHGPKNFLHLLKLDTLEVYGSRIWMLYKDVCKESLENFYKVVNFPKEKIDHAIDNYGEGISFGLTKKDFSVLKETHLPFVCENKNSEGKDTCQIISATYILRNITDAGGNLVHKKALESTGSIKYLCTECYNKLED